MQRGSKIALIGIIMVLVGIFGLGVVIEIFENSLMVNDWWEIYLEPNQSMSRGFDFSENEAYFYVDYFYRGNPLKIVITDSNDKVVLDKNINNYLVDVPFKYSPGYYVLEITNIGDEVVEIWDIGYQKPPISKDERGNFIVPSESWYSQILITLGFVGFPVAIIGGIIFWKDKRKTQHQQ